MARTLDFLLILAIPILFWAYIEVHVYAQSCDSCHPTEPLQQCVNLNDEWRNVSKKYADCLKGCHADIYVLWQNSLCGPIGR
ncbi:uncharacterized protein LOC117172787 isoform X2 [Belonocnema kinseyi]|uniref:uncharacterized protein LOC117172787 isoform X2 n=1 Tax=Belonocnema kinseyi TaxID=2817044 RepID=UPI00143CE3C2|nr:uncharacterized protein LOC117172787 isoform X2 [Belonocnema kinseyi]